MTKHESMTLFAKDASWGPRLVSAGFWTASTAFTGAGVFFSAQLVIDSFVLSLILAGIMTGMLTFSGYNLFHYAGKNLGKTSKPLRELASHVDLEVEPKMRKRALICGAGVMLVSSWFSFSSMVFLNFGDDLQRAMNEEIQAPLIAPIRQLENAMIGIERDAKVLAEIARERSAQEELSGGQCQPSPPGDGPITQLIAAHSQQTSLIAGQAEALREKASAARAAIQRATNQEDVDAAFTLAQAAIEDPARASILNRALELERGYEGNGFFREGIRITCPTGAPYMLPALRELATSAAADIMLPSDAMIFREATLIDSAMWQLRSAATLGQQQIPGISGWYLLLFGLLALTLDSLGALTAHMAGRVRGELLTEDERNDLENHHDALEDFVWITPGRYIKNASGKVIDYDPSMVMVMPTEAADKVSRDLIAVLQGVAAAYGLIQDTTRAARSLSDMPCEYSHLVRRLQRRGFTGDLIDYYRGDPEAWDTILEHQRLLRLFFSQGAKIPRHRYKIKKKPDNVTPLRSKL